MRILGIDPGKTGALVLLEDGKIIEWMMMPVMEVGNATRVNAANLTFFINQSKPDHIYVEKVGAMPGNAGAAMFNFGHSCGVIMGVIGALGIPHTLVTPQAWKKAAGLIGTDKDASRSKAISIWPEWRELDKKGKGQAYADAALMARYMS